MRQAQINYNNLVAGVLKEMDDGDYVFKYDKDYVKNHPDKFITFSMPVREEAFTDTRLFPFFEGLIPEGWLLDIATKNWKLNPNDRMGLLLACCQNCIGAVSVHKIETKDEA